MNTRLAEGPLPTTRDPSRERLGDTGGRRRFVLLAFLAWLAAHFLTGGKF